VSAWSDPPIVNPTPPREVGADDIRLRLLEE
jgi:hypothetical protein